MKEIYPNSKRERGGREGEEREGRVKKRVGRERWTEGKKEKAKKPEVSALLFFYPSHER